MNGFRKVVHRRAMPSANRGFTLIELIVVITILGILAAVALPRFTALQADARKAKADAIFGSVRAAAGVAKATALVKAVNCSTASVSDAIQLEGLDIDLEYCYPSSAADNTGILGAANITAAADGVTVSRDVPTNTLTIQVNGAASCTITYAPPAAANGTPTIINNASVGNC